MLDKTLASPYFGIFLSSFAYFIGLIINKRFKGHALANPLLIATILIVTLLKFTHITYDQYMVGGRFISFFIGPATVALVISLYENIDVLKENFIAITGGVIVGVLTSAFSTFFLAKLFRLDEVIRTSLLPRSITTAIGVSLSEEYGGLGDITTISIIITGIVGAITAQIILDLLRITDPVAKGIGIGTSAHALGTTKAMELGQVEGAMSGLSIAFAGILTVVLMPLIFWLLG